MKIKKLTLDLEVDGKEIHLEVEEGMNKFGNCYDGAGNSIGEEMSIIYFMGALAGLDE